jgi:DNA-binding NarL/FixJ family response regulator
MPIRILVADDDQVIRAGIVRMMSGTEIEVAGQASNCEQTLRYALTCEPDVVLLDLRMPDGDGFAVLGKIKQERPALPVLVFSVWDGLQEMFQARQLKANGYLSKSCGRDELLRAIRRAADGKDAWTRPQLRRTCRKSPCDYQTFGKDGVSLTLRERVVLGKLVEGLVNEEIAEELSIDLETVKQHVKNILKKIGVEDRTQAAIWAVRNQVG